MGFLKVAVPKTWDESKKDLAYIRKAGVRQFISTYNHVKDVKGDELLWGDEIEYGIFKLDHDTKKVRLSLRAKEVMDGLNEKESMNPANSAGCNWIPEFGAWMIEATPDRPYTGFAADLLRVERNMNLRRKRLLSAIGDDEIAPTISVHPMLGAQGNDGSVPATKVGGPQTDSDYIGDEIINPHPRFGGLTVGIRQRRGSKVDIRVPLFRDTNTPEFADYSEISVDGCFASDVRQPWRYGKCDSSVNETGKCMVTIGGKESDQGQGTSVQKWLGNDDGLVWHEVEQPESWMMLQKGYNLPKQNIGGKIKFFLHKNFGSNTPLFRSDRDSPDVSTLLADESEEKSIDTSASQQASNIEERPREETIRPFIHMDATVLGFGCCCLQITFQGKDVDESRFLYDQLAVMAPIMMALTASTPILKGRLADTDARWGIISESVDCRTPSERGRNDPNAPYPDYYAMGEKRLHKSRYDSISTYIYQGGRDLHNDKTGLEDRMLNVYNDIPVPIDSDTYEQLRSAGVDHTLSQHVAHLFIRDPLVIFNGAVEEVDDETQTDHWESIQSTNWQTVRWKPPPPRNSPNDPHIGWRTEFRSMELQLTDFENAAFTAFTVLLTRVILTFDLSMYIPLSKVDANMQRAHSRDAAAKGKFFFRRHMAPLEKNNDGYGVQYDSIFAGATRGESPLHNNNNVSVSSEEKVSNEEKDTTGDVNGKPAPAASGIDEKNSFEEMTMNEIMNGKGDYFPGLIPLIFAYLDHIQCDPVTMKRLTSYLDFIERRSKGELLTPATWMRNYVRSHPAYKQDSVVTDEIAYDLMQTCRDIGSGVLHVPELLGDVRIEPVPEEGERAGQIPLDSRPVPNEHLQELLRRYTDRKAFGPTV